VHKGARLGAGPRISADCAAQRAVVARRRRTALRAAHGEAVDDVHFLLALGHDIFGRVPVLLRSYLARVKRLLRRLRHGRLLRRVAREVAVLVAVVLRIPLLEIVQRPAAGLGLALEARRGLADLRRLGRLRAAVRPASHPFQRVEREDDFGAALIAGDAG